MTSQRSGLADKVSAVSPLGDALDGSAPAKPPARKGAAAKGIYEGWECPWCKREYPPDHAVRHLNAEVRSREEQLDRLGPKGVHTETDELGNLIVYGPAGSHAALWLRFGQLTVDSSVQRERDAGHLLMRPGVRLDQNKTEALTVVPVYAADDEDEGKYRLIGYRVVEGQHRALLGQDQDPDGWQLCKIADVESRQEESRLARQMSHSRKGFKSIEDWRALVREGQPNVLAATSALSQAGYLITSGGGNRIIGAADAVLKIIGIPFPLQPETKPFKSPQEGVRDLEDTLAVLEGMRPSPTDKDSRRYAAVLMRTVAEIITSNRDIIDVPRFAQQAGTRNVSQWSELPALGRTAGERDYLRTQMVTAYNKGFKANSKNRIS